MPLDGITAKLLSFELNSELAGSRIEKIHQPDSYDIHLRLRNANRNFQLVLSANPSTARLHITGDISDNPLVPLRFCTVLRKYLTGGKILSIDTPGYERIFFLRIQTMNEIGDHDVKTLAVEIMGRYSNIILLSETGRIIDAALHIDGQTSRVREILPTRMYAPPPPQNKWTPDETAERIRLHSFFPEKDSIGPIALDQYLLDHILGISPLFVRELCDQSGLSAKTALSGLTQIQAADLEATVLFYLNALREGHYRPAVFYPSADSYAPADFHAFSLHVFPFKKEFSTISAAMDAYYSGKAKANYLAQKKAALVRLVSQKQALIARKIVIHHSDLEECQSRDQSKRYGDLVLSNLHRILPGQQEVAAVDYYEEGLPERVIPLDATLSGSQNAQKYYKRYNKLKSKFESVSKLLEEEEKQLEYFQSVHVSLSNVDSNTDIDAVKEELIEWDARFNPQENRGKSSGVIKKKPSAKKPAPIPPRCYVSSEGYEILVGRNNLQNDQITTKTAHKEDIWLHIQKAPGTHVIVRTANKEPLPGTTIEEAAMLAAWFSKSSDASINTKVAIDYCRVKCVWKPKGATPGHVLYRDYSTVFVKTAFPENVKEIRS